MPSSDCDNSTSTSLRNSAEYPQDQHQKTVTFKENACRGQSRRRRNELATQRCSKSDIKKLLICRLNVPLQNQVGIDCLLSDIGRLHCELGIEAIRFALLTRFASIVCNFNVDLVSSQVRVPMNNVANTCYTKGPEIELVYPPDTTFSSADLSAICFNR
jgi:hypothetical protein